MNDFTPTEDMKSAATATFLAMAFVETVKPIVKGYQHEILNTYQWRTSDKELGTRGRLYDDEIVKDPDHTYMLPDEDFQLYLAECREAQARAGLKTDNPDHCPLLVAEHIQVNAEGILIEAMEPLTGVNKDLIFAMSDSLGTYRKYIDLSLKLMAPFVDAAI